MKSLIIFSSSSYNVEWRYLLFADGLLISTSSPSCTAFKRSDYRNRNRWSRGLMITMIMMGETEEKRTSDHSTFSSPSHLMLIRIFFLLYFSLNAVQYINSVNYVYICEVGIIKSVIARVYFLNRFIFILSHFLYMYGEHLWILYTFARGIFPRDNNIFCVEIYL